jgi:hypothetical protein
MRSSRARPAALRWSLTARISSRAAPSTSRSRVSAVSSANEVPPSLATAHPVRGRLDHRDHLRGERDLLAVDGERRAARRPRGRRPAARRRRRDLPDRAGDLRRALLERRPERPEVRLQVALDQRPGAVGQLDRVDVELVRHVRQQRRQPVALALRHGHERPRQRLADLHGTVVAGLPAEFDHPTGGRHRRSQGVVAPGVRCHGEVGQVHRHRASSPCWETTRSSHRRSARNGR